MKKVLIMFMLIIFSLTSCGDGNGEMNKVTRNDTAKIISPIDYGNGVFYFECKQKSFALSLSDFLKDNSRELISITSDNTYAEGFTKGYFVVIKK